MGPLSDLDPFHEANNDHVSVVSQHYQHSLVEDFCLKIQRYFGLEDMAQLSERCPAAAAGVF